MAANQSKRLLPLAAMEKILKQCGAERVSDKAKVALKNVIEDIAEEIAENAVKLALHAGRKTVKAGDVKLAAK
ncbi:histone family protein [Candidatus Woesearchaeota archaeon]|jgi:DNA-binding protein|nr:histone family protein [Candidatus Woesearchaeota archaeon]MBT6520121.1 histone family protein [Candidatus Woesearchaeota archaeon]MBT7366726.1 histone family protein [Candidatus Woesearchaeota archaeon]